MKEETMDMPGEALNRRLNAEIRTIENASILLEELKVDPSLPFAISKGDYRELSELLSEYEEFLEHFKELTEDLVSDIRDLVGMEECCYGERDEDEDDLEDSME
ncbi:MAG: hypothetical protein ACM3NG_00335 [Candidatus Doudnabacteria bacterium]